MPALTGPPLVVVFSSTAKISDAKVKKYTSASEKGLSVYEEIRTPTPFLGHTPSPASNATPSSSMNPPPAKRQRLKPTNINEGPAVPYGHAPISKRKRRRQVRQINLNVDMYFEDGIHPAPEPDFDQMLSEGESSDEEALPPPPPLVAPPLVEGTPEPEPTIPTPEDLDYGAGFTSYYVINDDEPEGGKIVTKAPPVRPPQSLKKPDVSRHQEQAHTVRAPHTLPTQPSAQRGATRPRISSGRAVPPPVSQQMMPAVPPPTVNIIDNISRNPARTDQLTIAEMIKKLDILSAALVTFGDIAPNAPTRPPQTVAPAESEKPATKGATATSSRTASNAQGDESVEGLLAMFDEDDDSDSDGGVEIGSSDLRKEGDGSGRSVTSPAGTDLNATLPTTGAPDTDLIYGIHFIMNALTTWAKQRINAMYTQQWHQYNAMVRFQQQNPPPKKGKGRPKKDEPRLQALNPPPPPSVINAELTHTPEGEAVQAFQDVLDCGVLRANGLLPIELTRALGTLYVQIDHLINNSSREEPYWECMSYQAQINTHRIKVDRWKEQLAIIQTELARQQELSHQHMMTQMGVPPHLQHRGTMSHEQALRHRDMSLELKRGTVHATQQPHLTPYLTAPMKVDDQNPNPRAVPSSASPPVNAGARKDSNPVHHPHQQQQSQGRDTPNQHSASNNSRVRDAMSRVTMYHDGKPANVAPEHHKALSMRSGQGMKFSFDHGESARKIFGDHAFPPAATATGSSIPRRGPMSRSLEHPAMVNGHAVSTPVLGSNAPPLNGEGTGPKNSDDVIVLTSEPNEVPMEASKAPATNRKAATPATHGKMETRATRRTSSDKRPASAKSASSNDVDAALPNPKKRKFSGDNITVNGAKTGSISASASPVTAPRRQTIRLRRSNRDSAASNGAATATPVGAE